MRRAEDSMDHTRLTDRRHRFITRWPAQHTVATRRLLFISLTAVICLGTLTGCYHSGVETTDPESNVIDRQDPDERLEDMKADAASGATEAALDDAYRESLNDLATDSAEASAER
jgi:hypothetical protein